MRSAIYIFPVHLERVTKTCHIDGNSQ